MHKLRHIIQITQQPIQIIQTKYNTYNTNVQKTKIDKSDKSYKTIKTSYTHSTNLRQNTRPTNNAMRQITQIICEKQFIPKFKNTTYKIRYKSRKNVNEIIRRLRQERKLYKFYQRIANTLLKQRQIIHIIQTLKQIIQQLRRHRKTNHTHNKQHLHNNNIIHNKWRDNSYTLYGN